MIVLFEQLCWLSSACRTRYEAGRDSSWFMLLNRV